MSFPRKGYDPFADGGFATAPAPPAATHIVWSAQTPAATQNYRGATWGNGQWVVVGGSTGGFMTSPDGITWTARTNPNSGTYSSVIWNSTLGLYIACANPTSAVITSPDGITWTVRTLPTANNCNSIAFRPSDGLTVLANASNNRMTKSTDGINWTDVNSVNGLWQSVKWVPELSLFVACSGTGTTMATSPDATTWTLRTAASNKNWGGLGWSASLGRLCSIANDGGLQTSPDGTTWTLQSAISGWFAGATPCENIPFGSGLFGTLYNATSAVAFRSSDGLTFTSDALPASKIWRGIAYSDTLTQFLAVGSSGALATGVPTP